MKESKIEWTDHTFNPWWGCMKVSDGCKNCYAETLDNRWKGGHWGPNSDRRLMSEEYWKQPIKWNKEAAKLGTRKRVFCASMADVFEGHEQTIPSLLALFKLIEITPWLTWQLLTKRPENIFRLIPGEWKKEFPDNVWIGTSVEDQKSANQRIPRLLEIPAKVRFLSCEPLLGKIDLTDIRINDLISYNSLTGGRYWNGFRVETIFKIDWVIAGGESGHGARPMYPDWVIFLHDQCKIENVPIFFKQWGEWIPSSQWGNDPVNIKLAIEIHKSGLIGKAARDKAKQDQDGYIVCYKVGKKDSGNLLDGVQHLNFPKP
jgi:protein gp37